MWRSLRLFLSGTATHLFFIRKLTLDMFYHIYHKTYSPFSTSPPTTNKKERKKWVDGWVGGCADEWMGEWIGGWMAGRMHGWMVACKLVAWVNGRTDRQTEKKWSRVTQGCSSRSTNNAAWRRGRTHLPPQLNTERTNEQTDAMLTITPLPGPRLHKKIVIIYKNSLLSHHRHVFSLNCLFVMSSKQCFTQDINCIQMNCVILMFCLFMQTM